MTPLTPLGSACGTWVRAAPSSLWQAPGLHPGAGALSCLLHVPLICGGMSQSVVWHCSFLYFFRACIICRHVA